MKFVFFVLAAAQILVLFASLIAVLLFVVRRLFKAYMDLGSAQAARRPPMTGRDLRATHHAHPVTVEGRR